MSESIPPGSSASGGGEPEPADATAAYSHAEAAEPEPPTAIEEQVPDEARAHQTYPHEPYTQQQQAYQQPGQQPAAYQHGGYPPQGYPGQTGYPPHSGYADPTAYQHQPTYSQPTQAGYGYPPPGYPQQGYAPPPGYSQQGGYQQPYVYAPPAAAGYGYTAARPRRRIFGIAAAVFTVIGGILLVISFTAVDWVSNNGHHLTFPDVRRALDAAPNPPGLPHAYFGWLAWVLFGVVVAFGIAGAFPTSAHVPFRIFGCLVGVAGIILTYFAYYKATGLSFSHSLQGATVGFYMALVGFLIAAVGAATGPHRTSTTLR